MEKPKRPWVKRDTLETLFPGRKLKDLTTDERRQYVRAYREQHGKPRVYTPEQLAKRYEQSRQWYRKNRERLNSLPGLLKEWHRYEYSKYGRKYRLKREYGITPEQYDAMKEAQGGKCAICDRTHSQLQPTKIQGDRLHVDHDHATGKVRGLLCHHCNMVLGHLDDDIERMRAAIQYLEFYRRQHGAVA